LARNQDNVSEWGDMAFPGLFFQCAITINNPTKRDGLLHSEHHQHLIDI
jgi:hypothetical protein